MIRSVSVSGGLGRRECMRWPPPRLETVYTRPDGEKIETGGEELLESRLRGDYCRFLWAEGLRSA